MSVCEATAVKMKFVYCLMKHDHKNDNMKDIHTNKKMLKIFQKENREMMMLADEMIMKKNRLNFNAARKCFANDHVHLLFIHVQ